MAKKKQTENVDLKPTEVEKPLDLTPTEIEQPKTNVLEATSTYVKPIKTSGKIVYSADKVRIEKNGKIIAMAVDRNIAESLVQNNPNLKIINNG